jgi:hypothetical protein
LPEEWKVSNIVPIYKNGDKVNCSNYRGISLFPSTYKGLSNILLPYAAPYAEEITGIINVDFDAIGQLLIIYSAFVKFLRKKLEYNEAVNQLFIDYQKDCNSVRREVLYNNLAEFGIP